MTVPKKKTSRSVRDMRRSHHFLVDNAAVEYCPTCGEPKLRHHLCAACGTYRGREVAKAKVAVESEPTAD